MPRMRLLHVLALAATLGAFGTPALAAPFATSLEIGPQTATMLLPSNLGATIKVSVPTGTPGWCGGKVVFKVNGLEVGQVSIGTTGPSVPSGGVTVHTISLPLPMTWTPPKWKAGSYTVSASYAGDATCAATQAGGATLTVKKIGTRIAVTPSGIAKPGTTVTIGAQLFLNNKPDGDPVAGQKLEAWFHGSAQPSKTTGADGKASWSWAVPPALSEAKVNLTIRHPADDVYDFSDAEKEIATRLTINPDAIQKSVIPK